MDMNISMRDKKNTADVSWSRCFCSRIFLRIQTADGRGAEYPGINRTFEDKAG